MFALGHAVNEDEWSKLTPTQRFRQSANAFAGLLTRMSEQTPIVLVIEDMHWVDAESEAALLRLAEVIPTHRLLLIATYRPEYRGDWGSRSSFQELRLTPLGRAEATQMLQTLLGPDPSIRPLIESIAERADGFPFFLEEMVHELEYRGLIEGEPGEFKASRTNIILDIPANVQAIIRSRLDRLRAEDKQLLQIASICGKDFPYTLLKEISGLEGKDIKAAIRASQGV